MSALGALITNTQNQIDAFTQSFTYQGYESLAGYLKAPLGSLCVLYIILMGYGILLGYIKTPIEAFRNIILRMGIIVMFGMHWGTFAQYFNSLFIDGATELGARILQVSSHTNITALNDALQSALNDIIALGQQSITHSSFRNWSPMMIGVAIDGIGTLVIGLVFFELVLAKMMLAICLCFAPLFFIFTLFDITRHFFDRWLGTLVGFALVFVFVSAVAGLCMHLLNLAIAPHLNNPDSSLNFAMLTPILFMGMLCIMLVLEVTGIAKSIGGACASSNGSAMVGAFIGGALGASRLLHKGTNLMQKGIDGSKNLARKGINTMQSIQKAMRGTR